MLKKRKMKNSKRGLYLQDKELIDTKFTPGTHFKYAVDLENKKIVILPTKEDAGNTVSKRRLKDSIKPVIDIRRKETLSVFEGCDYLQVEIFDDQIIIDGFVDEQPSALSNLVQKAKGKVFKRQANDIRSLLSVKRKASIVLSKSELRKAVGQHEFTQLDLFEQIAQQAVEQVQVSEDKVLNLQEKIKNVAIPLQAISLFSGAGGIDLGFIDEGFEIVYALEKDEHAAATYRKNIGNHIVTADIKKVEKETIPNASCCFGGPPCQGFSNSNRYTNYLDNPNNLLVREFIDAVKVKDVDVFVLENVPQILTAGNGKFLKEIKEELSDYHITHGVLNAADFGSPQARERAFVIGSLHGFIELPKPVTSKRRTVREAFKGIHKMLPNALDISEHKPITVERMRHVPQGGYVMDIPEDIRPKGTHSNMYRRLSWDKESCTIVNARKAVIMPPEGNRILSVREMARLMDFPDTFAFLGPLSARQQQIANSVPINLVRAVARQVKHAIMKYNLQNRGAGMIQKARDVITPFKESKTGQFELVF